MGDGESNFYRVYDSINTYLIDTYQVLVGAYCIRPSTYRADDSFSHCHRHLWGVCDTPLHRYPKNGALWVGGFNGESNFWRVQDSMRGGGSNPFWE